MASGTYNLWIDSHQNPDAFEPGVRQRLGSFKLGNEICVLSSDGSDFVATTEPGTDRERSLFRLPLALPRTRRRHLITIGWSKGCMRILLDAKVLVEIPATFLLWLLSVSGVIFTHCH